MLVSIYGVSSPTTPDREQLNAIVLEIMALADSKGAVGCCLGGDFNLSLLHISEPTDP